MDQNIPQANNALPRHLGIFIPKFFREFTARLADDLKVSYHRINGFSVFLKFSERKKRCVILY
jgi:hypothetical protein